MPVAKKRKIKEYPLTRIMKNIEAFVKANKYLSDSKYFKSNYWSTAAWDSWAMKGTAGGCSCCHNDYYYATLHNKRHTTNKGGRESWIKEVSGHVCPECLIRVEEFIKTTFPKY